MENKLCDSKNSFLRRLILMTYMYVEGESLTANHGSIVLIAGVELVGTTMPPTFTSVVVREANSRAIILVASVESVLLDELKVAKLCVNSDNTYKMSSSALLQCWYPLCGNS